MTPASPKTKTTKKEQNRANRQASCRAYPRPLIALAIRVKNSWIIVLIL